ncbi:hypothetical protein BG74_08605 [Sodalis-like endosymbiont of Proechinophthirus fluctus]|nr:hypothetical protein BG74_08605 [Sodalis-like endosymbiont of Proechinophthirus fluctus]
MELQGASKSFIGLAIGIYGLTQAIFQIPLSLVSDRVGRKLLIVSGFLIVALGSAIAALTDNILGVILQSRATGIRCHCHCGNVALLSNLTYEKNKTALTMDDVR